MIPTRACAGAALGMLAWGCAAPPDPAGEAPDAVPPPVRVAVDQRTPMPATVRPLTRQDPEFGPDVLLPPGTAENAVVVRAGDLELRKSHVYDRLLAIRPKLALQIVDLLVLDVLVALHAREYGIRIDPAEVKALAAREVELIRSSVEEQSGGTMTFEEYAHSSFSMGPEEFRDLVTLRLVQRRYHDLVIRFLTMREERVRVRAIVNRDRELMQEIAAKTRAGADFGTLALQHSEDRSSRDNGLLPPFGRDYRHPIVEEAFGLEPGEVSPLIAEELSGGATRYWLVYCIEHLPGRKGVPFEEMREEVERSLEESPRSEFESQAYIMRHSDRLDGPGGVVRTPANPMLNNEGEKR